MEGMAQLEKYSKNIFMKRLINKIPKPIKVALRPFYFLIENKIRNLRTSRKSRDELYKYWEHPYDGRNSPQDYIQPIERSEFLLKFIKKYVQPRDKILEIGCNVGRNLNCLFNAGYKNLEGIEISKEAVDLMKEIYPEMSKSIKVYDKSIEEIIKKMTDIPDVIFTMAVFQHIHPDSNFIFPEIVNKVKKYLITIEDENGISWRHFQRNYRKIFESLKMKQVEEFNCKDVNSLGSAYRVRVFKKAYEE
jgi:hypothetical protein